MPVAYLYRRLVCRRAVPSGAGVCTGVPVPRQACRDGEHLELHYLPIAIHLVLSGVRLIFSPLAGNLVLIDAIWAHVRSLPRVDRGPSTATNPG